MRIVHTGIFGALAFALAMATYGCGNSTVGDGGAGSGGGGSGGVLASGGARSGGNTGGGAGSGGFPASGGSSGSTTTQPACPNGPSCGGDLIATWNVTSSCLTLTGRLDVSETLGCASVPISGTLDVTGTWTANSNGTYTDNTVTKGNITFPVEDACLSISSVPVACPKLGSAITALGWKSATCANNESGKCNCSATGNQIGGIGVISPWADTSGSYTTSGSGLRTDDHSDYLYCVSGNTLTFSPKPTFLPMTGTVVLQRNGTSSGTGGGPGSGGKTGTGGSTVGSGGAPGSGGATLSSGGKIGTGGSTMGSGGAPGSGGATLSSGGKIGTGGSAGAGGSTGVGGGTGNGPCDIYAAASHKCVAAHSTIRALFGSYSGPLYQVRRASDKTTKDIGVLSPGGLADSSIQDTFCTGTTCVITKIYDQSGLGNYLQEQSADSVADGVGGKDSPASATNEFLNVGGKKVYSLYMKPSNAYWRDGSKTGVPTGASPQGIYMVTSGKHFNSGCCFDYGNGPTSRVMSGGGTMDALYFGNSTTWGSGNGTGPWVMADLEGGIYSQGSGGKNDSVLSLTHTYVTAVEKNNGTSEFSLKGGDATTGNLSTFYKGKLPAGYSPMKKQGAIVLGSGGDCCYSNSNQSQGTFYEGAIVTGYPSDATDEAIQANIVSAGYGK